MKNGTYEFICKITAANNPRIWLIEECIAELDIDVDWASGAPEANITDVYLYGERLPKSGDALTAELRKRIETTAYADIQAGGDLWARIQEREGIRLSGAAGSPDAHWQQVA